MSLKGTATSTFGILGRRNCESGFRCVLVDFDILALFRNRASVSPFAGCLLNEGQKPLLSILHERFKIIRAQNLWIDKMRVNIYVYFLRIN